MLPTKHRLLVNKATDSADRLAFGVSPGRILYLGLGGTGPQVLFTPTFTLARHPLVLVSILIEINRSEGIVVALATWSPFVVLVEASEAEGPVDSRCLAPGTTVICIRVVRGPDGGQAEPRGYDVDQWAEAGQTAGRDGEP